VGDAFFFRAPAHASCFSFSKREFSLFLYEPKTLRYLKTLFLVTILCGAILPAFAQEEFKDGFIVDSNQNYVYGFISITNTPHLSCIFKEKKDGNPVTYSSGQIDGYGFINGDHFRKRKIDINGLNEDIFAKAVTDGRPVVLYTALGRLFIERGSSFYEIKNEQTYRNTLMSLVGDCGNFEQKAKKLSITEFAVKTLVNEYNQCAAGGGAPPRTKSIRDLGVFAGIDRTNFSMEGSGTASLENESFTDRTLLSGGLQYKFTPKRSRHFSLVTGLWFTDQRLYLSGMASGSGYARVQTVRINYQALKVPLLLEAGNFMTSKIQPYVKGGLSLPITLKSNVTIDHENENNNVIYINQYAGGEDFKEPLLIHLMGGFTLPISGRLHVYGELYYSKGKNKFKLETPQTVSGKFSGTGFNVGLVVRSN
jgi:hypothetical protein